MSALPSNVFDEHPINDFSRNVVERTDDSILTDEQVYELKGGDFIFALKFAAGLGAVALSLIKTKKINELTTFSLSSSTFFWNFLLGLGTMNLVQRIYMKTSGNNRRYMLHKSALFNRWVLNYSQIYSNKKKPKIH